MGTKEKKSGELGNNSENSQLDNDLQHNWDSLDEQAKEYIIGQYQHGFEGMNTLESEKGLMTEDEYEWHKQYWEGWIEAMINTFPESEMKRVNWMCITAWIGGEDIEEECNNPIDTNKIYFRTPTDRDKCIGEINAVIKKYQKLNLFADQLEQTAIERIQKFAKIAGKMGFEVCLGFSGGKDSQVCYDLCKRSGIVFKAYYNVAFESNTTKRFISEHYPDVIWRKNVPYGFIENISANHKGFLPTVQAAYCCRDFKHNPKNVDNCSIVGVRRAESNARSSRTAFSAKNKTTLKKNKELVSEYFVENCQSVGGASVIQLMPIVDWSDDDIWDYIYKYNLPVNPEYHHTKRVGCIVCPKSNFTRNFYYLMKYPKLIDAFILARERGSADIDWMITGSNMDCSDNKPYYICRWLNRSFMPFTKRQEELYKRVRARYDAIYLTPLLMTLAGPYASPKS